MEEPKIVKSFKGKSDTERDYCRLFFFPFIFISTLHSRRQMICLFLISPDSAHGPTLVTSLLSSLERQNSEWKAHWLLGLVSISSTLTSLSFTFHSPYFLFFTLPLARLTNWGAAACGDAWRRRSSACASASLAAIASNSSCRSRSLRATFRSTCIWRTWIHTHTHTTHKKERNIIRPGRIVE